MCLAACAPSHASLHRNVATAAAAQHAQHQLWRTLREAGAKTGQVAELPAGRGQHHVVLLQAVLRGAAAALYRLDHHAGEAALAHRLVDACADAGVFAIKLQVFDTEQLLVADAPAPAHVQAASLRAFFAQYELRPETYAAIVCHARERGLAVVATAFDASSVAMLDALGIDAFKVASGDLTHAGLIADVSRSGRPVILSTGLSEAPDVARAVGWARDAGAATLAVLHCVSAYPTPDDQQNLRAVGTVARPFDLAVGLSDHGMDSDAALRDLAAALAGRGRRADLTTSGGVSFVSAYDPDGIRIVVAHPSPEELPRAIVAPRLYS